MKGHVGDSCFDRLTGANGEVLMRGGGGDLEDYLVSIFSYPEPARRNPDTVLP